MEITVTNSVKTIVRNLGVTFPMEPVLIVHLDGKGTSVNKVESILVRDLCNVFDVSYIC